MKRSAVVLSALGLTLSFALTACAEPSAGSSNAVDIGRSGGTSCGTATSFALYAPIVNGTDRPWTLRSVEPGAARDVDLQAGVVGADGMGEEALQGIPEGRARVAYLVGEKESASFHPEVADGLVVKPGETVVAVVAAESTSRDRLAGFQGMTVVYRDGEKEQEITVDDAVWGALPDISHTCDTAPARVTAG